MKAGGKVGIGLDRAQTCIEYVRPS
jgi:hypothetical protein